MGAANGFQMILSFPFVTLIDRVAHECHVEPAAILSKSRAASDARSIAIYCARQMWGTSYERLAPLFARTPSGVYRLDLRVVYLMEYDKRVQRIVHRIMEMEATS